MWTARIKVSTKGTLIGALAQRHKVDFHGFPVSAISEGKWIRVSIAGTLSGEEQKIKAFVSEIKKEKRIPNIELNDNFLIMTILEPGFMKWFYNENIIHVSPAIISHEGYEIAHIASFKRVYIEEIMKTVRRYDGKLLSIKQERLKGISVMNVTEKLTEKQRKALELAVMHGYYHSPRKITVEELAKISRLSFSTYQVHLRKAESKLMPQLLR